MKMVLLPIRLLLSGRLILDKCQSKDIFNINKFSFRYEAYYPIRFAQMSSKPGVDFDTFNKAVDEFYSSMEIKKSEVQVIQSVGHLFI